MAQIVDLAGRTRRTDAIIKGDMFDGVMAQQADFERQNLPEHIWDYPDTLVRVLKAFYKYWNIPAGAIPTKKQKGNYSLWIEQLTTLTQIFPESSTEKVMELSHVRYRETGGNIIIARPLAIKTYIIDAMRIMKDESEKESLSSLANAQPPAEKKDLQNTINRLDSFFEE